MGSLTLGTTEAIASTSAAICEHLAPASRGDAPSLRGHASKRASTPPRSPPEGFLSTPSSPREACRTPRKHPGAPWTPQEPRQEVPDTLPGAPQDAPGAPQEAPRKAPDPREEVPRRPPGGPQIPQELGESPASQPPALLSAEAGSRSVCKYSRRAISYLGGFYLFI